MKKQTPKNELAQNFKRISEISEWFDTQEEIDVEAGLLKVKEAAELIAKSKNRLKTIENEFEEIHKNIKKELKD